MAVHVESPPEITLTIVAGPCGQKKARFCQEKISIGRGKNSAGELPDFILDEDNSVSREQAVIVFENGQYSLVNRSVHKSTAVNGHFCDKHSVSNGDIVEVGSDHTRIRIGLKGRLAAGIHFPENKNILQGIWLATGGLVLLLSLIILGKVLVDPPAAKELPHDEAMRLALQARNVGDLEKAVDLLMPSTTITDDDMDFYIETKALASRFERARHFEDVLQLEQALDEWRIIGVSILEENDPLQAWVQTGQVVRLENRLREIGR